MAVAFDVAEETSAVRTKGVRQRTLHAVGGTRGTESFGLDEDERRKRRPRKRYDRLNHVELDELKDLWGMYDSSIGLRSSQGAVQARLIRAMPRDEIRSDVMDEVRRAGGRMPEGALLRIIAADRGRATTYEVRRALGMLINYGKLEKVAVEPPPSPTRVRTKEEKRQVGIENVQMLFAPDNVTDAQREWTGYDVRIKRVADYEKEKCIDCGHARSKHQEIILDDGCNITHPDSCSGGRCDCTKFAEGDEGRERGDLTMRTALASTAGMDPAGIAETSLARRAKRWQRQDDAIEAEWRQCYCSEDQSGSYASADSHDGLSAKQRASMERATASLALIVPSQRLVLRRFYFENGNRFASHQFDWALASDPLLCVAEFTERAKLAARVRASATIVSLLREREADEDWLDQLRDSCNEIVDESSLAYKAARRAVGVA